MKIEDDVTDKIAQTGAKAIFEQYIYKKLKEQRHKKEFGKSGGRSGSSLAAL